MIMSLPNACLDVNTFVVACWPRALIHVHNVPHNIHLDGCFFTIVADSIHM